jgi:hypothetical protein
VSQGRRRHNLLLLPVILLLTVFAAPAQAQGITLEVEAGFDSFFRENQWFPIRVQASNAGADRSGRLVLRPETSGKAFSNTFSTALELPAGGLGFEGPNSAASGFWRPLATASPARPCRAGRTS